jgi:4'-phosphopantetheinyl transferase
VLGIPYREISIGRTKGRKPFLCTPHSVDWAPNFNFNVSHEGRYVALATENLCVVGVDVAAPLSERNQSVPQLFANLDTVCSPREWNDIRKQGSEEQQMGAFQRRWSLKEAFVKARGDGLAFEPLSRAEFTIDGPLSSLQPRVCVDGHARPEWKFFLEERDGYWFSVSRAPPKAIIDAVGKFTRTLRRRSLALDDLQKALAAPNPTSVIKSVRDLLPAEALRKYDELVDADCARRQ